jgi:hypothetical protein
MHPARAEFESLFNGKCAVQACDRRPARGSLFCASCKEDRRLQRVVVFRSGQEMLPNDYSIYGRGGFAPQPAGLSKSEASRSLGTPHRGARRPAIQ